MPPSECASFFFWIKKYKNAFVNYFRETSHHQDVAQPQTPLPPQYLGKVEETSWGELGIPSGSLLLSLVQSHLAVLGLVYPS